MGLTSAFLPAWKLAALSSTLAQSTHRARSGALAMVVLICSAFRVGSIISASVIDKTAARFAQVVLGKQIHIKPHRLRRRDVSCDQTIVQGLENCNGRGCRNKSARLPRGDARGTEANHGLILIKFVAHRRTFRKRCPMQHGHC
jgi:hypothetical protein